MVVLAVAIERRSGSGALTVTATRALPREALVDEAGIETLVRLIELTTQNVR